jgi:hypothetical protein
VDGFKSVTIVLKNWAGTHHTRTYILAGARQVFVIDDISTSKVSLPKQITWHIQPDMMQISPSQLENENYAISLSENTKDNIKVIHKNASEISAFSEFSSDKYISLVLTGFEKYTAVTAFSSKDNLVSEINIISDSSLIYQKVFSYKLSGEQKYLVLTEKNQWSLVDYLDK